MPHRHPRRRFAKLEALSPNELEQRLGVRSGGRLTALAWFGPTDYAGPGILPDLPRHAPPQEPDAGCVVWCLYVLARIVLSALSFLAALVAIVSLVGVAVALMVKPRRLTMRASVEAHAGGLRVRRPFRRPVPIRWDEVEEVERLPESGTVLLKTAHGWIYVRARDSAGGRLAAAAGLAVEAREAGVSLPGESAPGEPVSEAAISLVVEDEPNDRGISPAEDA